MVVKEEEGQCKGQHTQAQFALQTGNHSHLSATFPGSFFPLCCGSGTAGCWGWWQLGCALSGTEQQQAARLKSRGQKRRTHAKAQRIREPAVEGQVEQGKRWDSAAKSLEAGAAQWGSD